MFVRNIIFGEAEQENAEGAELMEKVKFDRDEFAEMWQTIYDDSEENGD